MKVFHYIDSIYLSELDLYREKGVTAIEAQVSEVPDHHPLVLFACYTDGGIIKLLTTDVVAAMDCLKAEGVGGVLTQFTFDAPSRCYRSHVSEPYASVG